MRCIPRHYRQSRCMTRMQRQATLVAASMPMHLFHGVFAEYYPERLSLNVSSLRTMREMARNQTLHIRGDTFVVLRVRLDDKITEIGLATERCQLFYFAGISGSRIIWAPMTQFSPCWRETAAAMARFDSTRSKSELLVLWMRA